MITWRILEIWEMPIRCYARRGPRSKVVCERPALHDHEHIGRGRIGQWFIW
jgi:hypothetical protein